MRSTSLKLSVLMVILFGFACFSYSEAIYCWQCNSIKSQFCADVPPGPITNSSKLESCLQEMYKECPKNGDLPYTFCRKNEQIIQNEKRVIRSCGYDKASTDCYITKTPFVTTRVCQCFEDGCNSASHATISIITLLICWLINRFLTIN